MSTFVNPLAHVVERDLTISVSGKDVPFTELGLKEVGRIAERFPAMRSMLTGDAEFDADQFTDEDDSDLAVLIIQLALAPKLTAGPQLKSLEQSIRAMRKVERDLAMAKIMKESFPGSETISADVGNGAPKPAKAAGKAGTKTKTKTKPARKTTARRTAKPKKS